MPPCIRTAGYCEWQRSAARTRPGRATWCRTSRSATAAHPAAPHRHPAADRARSSRAPTTAARRRSARRRSGIRRGNATGHAGFLPSADLHPWIEQRIQKIDDEYAGRDAEDGDGGHAEHEPVVPRIDGVDQERADTRIAKYLFGDHGAVEDSAERNGE